MTSAAGGSADSEAGLMPMFEVLLSTHFLTVEKGADFGFPETPVSTGRPDASDSPRRRPTGDGFRVDAEQCGHFARR